MLLPWSTGRVRITKTTSQELNTPNVRAKTKSKMQIEEERHPRKLLCRLLGKC